MNLDQINELINRGQIGAVLAAIALVLLLAFGPKILGKTKKI